MSSSREMWHLNDFELGSRIGAGTFGHVQLVRERRTKIVAALKVIGKHRIERLRVQRRIEKEIQIQGHLRHPNVLRLYGFFWDASKIYMILEHAAEGDLDALLQKQPDKRFAEPEAARWIAEAADAIAYCHRMHVIHRDIKPQNILVGRGNKLKLADFGWAVHTSPDERRLTMCGTIDYLPPEMVHVTDGHSFPLDVWALGILAYELLIGQPPFYHNDQRVTYQRILAAKPEFPEELLASTALAGESEPPSQPPPCKPTVATSSHSKDFVRQLLQRDPSKRPSAPEVVEHVWLSGGRIRTIADVVVGAGLIVRCDAASGSRAAAAGA